MRRLWGALAQVCLQLRHSLRSLLDHWLVDVVQHQQSLFLVDLHECATYESLIPLHARYVSLILERIARQQPQRLTKLLSQLFERTMKIVNFKGVVLDSLGERLERQERMSVGSVELIENPEMKRVVSGNEEFAAKCYRSLVGLHGSVVKIVGQLVEFYGDSQFEARINFNQYYSTK